MEMIGLASLALAAAYSVLVLLAVLVWQMRRTTAYSQPLPPVTLLKPLCGAEPGLYEHLRSFCQQDKSDDCQSSQCTYYQRQHQEYLVLTLLQSCRERQKWGSPPTSFRFFDAFAHLSG